MIIQKKTTIQLIKFAMVGVLNTTLSLVVIYSLMTFFHVGVYTANIWGYVVGVTNMPGNSLFLSYIRFMLRNTVHVSPVYD